MCSWDYWPIVWNLGSFSFGVFSGNNNFFSYHSPTPKRHICMKFILAECNILHSLIHLCWQHHCFWSRSDSRRYIYRLGGNACPIYDVTAIQIHYMYHVMPCQASPYHLHFQDMSGKAQGTTWNILWCSRHHVGYRNLSLSLSSSFSLFFSLSLFGGEWVGKFASTSNIMKTQIGFTDIFSIFESCVCGEWFSGNASCFDILNFFLLWCFCYVILTYDLHNACTYIHIT